MTKKELNKWVFSHVGEMTKTAGFDLRHPMRTKLQELLFAEIKAVVAAKVNAQATFRLADQVFADARQDLRARQKAKQNGQSNTASETNG
jgi:hypothetical protein